MEHVFATRSVSITELKRSPSAVLEQAPIERVLHGARNLPVLFGGTGNASGRIRQNPPHG